MAVEAKRGCGYRKVGATYLIGGVLSEPCDRLPMPLEVCPHCGQGIKVSRGFTKIHPQVVFGKHKDCKDVHQPCMLCQPTKAIAFIMLAGEKYYTPASFTKEAQKLGVSKRIAFVPKELKLKKTVIYLAHHKACVKKAEKGAKGKNNQGKLLEYQTGIFSAFIPTKVEKLVWANQLKGKKGKALKRTLRKRGITPVAIPNGDKDHK